ncbi:Carbonic anhydrase [Mycena indigotica]|uniref:Carbonic anhydrase n=1 Tax=Mycena indigotica TaxID=2126181 RepID=A0A8H6T1R5_9AGAR|nr:Carbonic anhydrase [Mycena indigotica]KAF7309319.1 Carbonic anhydrase [Mycena indigotica]
MFTRLLVSSLAVTYASASCMHGTSFMPRAEGKVDISKFGYSGLQGPLNWAGLDPANSACRSSKVQSPIVLDDSVGKAKSKPKIEIETLEETEFENLGTTLEVVIGEGKGKTTVEGKEFDLKQFHLHTPSEHRINDEYFPLEMHMVHQAKDASIAVIAIPFQLTEDGSTTELLTAATANLKDVGKPGTATKTGKLDFAALIKAVEDGPLFQYTGSLTTPPCAEGLTFLVLEKPLPRERQDNKLGESNLLAVSTELFAKEDGCKTVTVNKNEQPPKKPEMEHKMMEPKKPEMEPKKPGMMEPKKPEMEPKKPEMNMEKGKMDMPKKPEMSHEMKMKEECGQMCKHKRHNDFEHDLH